VVARDAVATLAAFADRRDPTKRERVWQADALLQLGRRGEADAVWTELLAADPLDADLMARLRGEPATYGPLLHALDPAGHVARLAAVWRNTAANHLHDPRAREAMAAALAPLDIDASLAAASDDAGRGAVADLLGWRGRLWARAGETARARADLERVLAIVATLGDEAPQRSLAWMQWIELATLAAGEDDPARAREAIRRARETSNMPLLVDDIVRARASLAALAGP